MKRSYITTISILLVITGITNADIVKTVNGWDGYDDLDDFLAPGYDDQYTHISRAFWIDSHTVTINVRGMGLNSHGYVVAHLYNWHTKESWLGCRYIGDSDPDADPTYALSVGEKPLNYLFIADDDGDGIYVWYKEGVLRVDDSSDSGEGEFDRSWYTNQIEFNGVLGAVENMPSFEGPAWPSQGPYLPAINLVPEPSIILLFSFGGLLAKRSNSRSAT